MKPLFNPRVFGRLVARRLKEQELSYRSAGKKIGISSATLGRVIGGKPPDIETYFRLTKWLWKDAPK